MRIFKKSFRYGCICIGLLLPYILFFAQANAVTLYIDYAMAATPDKVLKGLTVYSTEVNKCINNPLIPYPRDCDEIIIDWSEKYKDLSDQIQDDWDYYKLMVPAIYLRLNIKF